MKSPNTQERKHKLDCNSIRFNKNHLCSCGEFDTQEAGERTQRIPRDFDAPGFAFSEADEQAAVDAAVRKAQHTTGPWHVHRSGGWQVMAGECVPIATVATGVIEGVYRTEAIEANARLIAAAPELLETIVDLVRQITANGPISIVAARMAIAKAGGK